MKDYLEKLIRAKEQKANELRELIKKSESADEVRSLGETLDGVIAEINDAKTQLNALDAEANDEARSFNPMASLGATQMNDKQKREADVEDSRATMEYRTAFKEYIQTGKINKDVLQFENRGTDATGTSSNLNVLIPTTVMQEIIKDVEKIYGQLYSRVKKTNLKGGVKYPIGSFNASFVRITETTKSDRQNAGGVTGSIDFSYKIGEIRLARTLLQTILSVPVFEEEFSKVIAEAYVKAMDKEIMIGEDSHNECVGIITEANNASQTTSRFYGLTDHIIEFSASDMADWSKWQTKLFAKIPLGMRSERPIFVMTPNTYEANIKTLKDANDRPLYNETFNPIDGTEICTFKGKEVVLVEDDILANFDDAGEDGDFFAMYFVPEKAYAINTNYEFSVVDYFDHETNQYVKKALVVNDGKVLDATRIYLLKRAIEG